jgi:flagella basal body P-ring formation protein FlgA
MSALALALTAHVAATCPDTRATVLDLGHPPETGAPVVWSIQGNPCRERPLLRAVGRREGAVVRSVTLRPHLDLERRGWIVEKAVDAGRVVDLTPAWVPFRTPRLRDTTGLEARRDLVAGQVVTPLDVEARMDAHKGDTVAIVVRRGSLTLTAEGRLLTDARLDAPARALNPSTGTVLRGVLVDSKTVEIR